MSVWTEVWLADYVAGPYAVGAGPKKTRAKPIQREHIVQRHIKNWVRDCVAAPHKFLAHDRTKGAGRFTHAREKSRGIQKATPDTELMVANLPTIWCELKAPGKKPGPDQLRMGRELQALGQIWFWTTTVTGYMEGLMRFGVPLRPNAITMADLHDAGAAATIAAAEAKRGEMPKKARSRGPALRDAALDPPEALDAWLDEPTR